MTLTVPALCGTMSHMETPRSSLGSIIDGFVVSFRNHDIGSCEPHIAEGFQWFIADGSLVLEGKESFLKGIEEFWKVNPDVVNASSICVEVGNLVAHTETFTGFSDGHTSENMWVYEFQGVQIRKMYGFTTESSI